MDVRVIGDQVPVSSAVATVWLISDWVSTFQRRRSRRHRLAIRRRARRHRPKPRLHNLVEEFGLGLLKAAHQFG